MYFSPFTFYWTHVAELRAEDPLHRIAYRFKADQYELPLFHKEHHYGIKPYIFRKPLCTTFEVPL
jgi:hypothetical protein